ncbi:phenylacetyl-CoA ligase [Penicillium brasilianum]|uniref:Phenylacetyl-CoA ligase n=1 Tax=Penicillium brasilianum TaxID=104259 RepID=A0A1S9RMH6_PENBI|nr:phenylacetyl-CoA ligase [Penicillium brasilianum]
MLILMPTVIFQDADFPRRKFTYAEIKQQSVDFGEGLISNHGFRKGDVVALYASNDIDFAPVVIGTLWAGGTVTLANPGYTVTELVHQLKDSGAKFLVTQISELENAEMASKEVGIPESSIVLLGKDSDPSRKFKHWTRVRNFSGSQGVRATKVEPMIDLAFLVYSSGTTGPPKGVRLSHHNITSNIEQMLATEGHLAWNGSKNVRGIPDAPKGKGDKILACMPFFHIYGLNLLVHSPLHTGVTTLVLRRFDLERWCSFVQEHQVTFSYIVPPIVLLLCKEPIVDMYDLSSLRMTNSGAAPLTRDLVESLYKRKGVRVKQGYGLSETSPALFLQRWEDWLTTAGSTGWLMPNVEAKFCAVPEVDEASQDTREVARGQTGELYVKGPNVFLGYHNNQAATAECLKDGWFRTGDVGFIDKDGNLTITDRIKELIKYKGFQVAPAELEGYLQQHNLVEDVCVVGVHSPALGTEVPRAYIVRKGGLDAVKPGDAQEISRWLSEKVANHKRLRGGIKFTESVPKSASGKILRRVLKEQAKKDFEEDPSTGKQSAKL